MDREKIKVALFMLVIVVLIAFAFYAVNTYAEPVGDAWMQPELEEQYPVSWSEEYYCTFVDDGLDYSESEISRARMIEEVALLWTMYFNDDHIKQTDKRRTRFREFAGYVADAVFTYQNSSTANGGRLPGHKNDHLVVAYTIARETSVRYRIVGTSDREVGLMQCHGRALGGHPRKRVRNNPRLGIDLGVAWLTSRIPICYPDYQNWDQNNWAQVLSVYAAGGRALRSDGSCGRLTKSTARSEAVKGFRTRIDRVLGNQSVLGG